MAGKTFFKNKKIGVLMGGISAEREISLRTGNAVLAALKEKGYKAIGIDAGRDLATVLLKKKIDVAFLALHGRYGEDGCVQGLLEVMGIPYTGSGVQASSIAMDKVSAKKIMIYHGVSTPRYMVYCCPDEKLPRPPFIIKPACQGSAIGVSIVKKISEIGPALRKAKKCGGPILIEEFIEGRELTVSILDGDVLPVIEIRPKDGFYDYRHKYTKGMTDFVVPANIKKDIEKKVVRESLAAYGALGCWGAARIDVMLDAKGRPYVLEVNTIPGMTELSLFPRAAAAAGLNYASLVEKMLLGAGLNKA